MTENRSTQGTGRSMIFMAWIGLLILLSMLFNELLIEKVNPNRDPVEQVDPETGRKEVVLKRNAQGHYVATGRVNGMLVDLLVDTGATDITLPHATAKRLGLKLQKGGFSQTANGLVAVWRTELSSVSIGAVHLEDISAVVLPPGAMSGQILLGMNFLKRLEMIQRNGTLTLRQD